MKIVIKQSEDHNGELCENMEINGKDSLSVGPLCECPEDAIIGRDLVSCSDVARYMRAAYDAGKNGEELSIETIKE